MTDLRKRVLWITCAAILVLLAVAGTLLIYRARRIEAQLRQLIVQALNERFSSEVELQSFRYRFFPHFDGYGENLVLRHHSREDVPPLIRVGRFSFSVGITG